MGQIKPFDNCVQTNDLCLIELSEIDLFHNLTVCKQMTKSSMIDNNTFEIELFDHLTV